MLCRSTLKHLFIVISVLSFLTYGSAMGQSYNKPSSVVYASDNDSYYIANPGSNTILRRDNTATLSVFVTAAGLDNARAMCIREDNGTNEHLLFVANNDLICVFNLQNGQQDSSYTVSGASALSGLVIDNSGNYLYASDPVTNKIYRIDRASGHDTAIVASGLNKPYGLYYDGSVGRLMIAENDAFNATIKTWFILDGSLLITVPHPAGQMAGITRDGAGYWYVSSQSANEVYRYHPSFIPAPITIPIPGGGLDMPGSLYCNNLANPDILAIPSANNNEVYFLPIITTETESHLPTMMEVTIFPNPSHGDASLRIELARSCLLKLSLKDAAGHLIKVLVEEKLPMGSSHIIIHEPGLASGLYFLDLQSDDYVLRKPWIIEH